MFALSAHGITYIKHVIGAFYGDLVLFIIDDMSLPARLSLMEGRFLGDYSSFFHLRAINLQPRISIHPTLVISGGEDNMGQVIVLAMIRFLAHLHFWSSRWRDIFHELPCWEVAYFS